jgi:hypothetical protein
LQRLYGVSRHPAPLKLSFIVPQKFAPTVWTEAGWTKAGFSAGLDCPSINMLDLTIK